MTARVRLLLAAGAVWFAAVVVMAGAHAGQPARPSPSPHAGPVFKTADSCMACHNGITTATGEDISIGADWRGSIMANSSRDPYWQAAVRRETLEHPAAAAEIEDECAVCHMPMSRTLANASGRKARVFDHLPVRERHSGQDQLAHDGVSCTLCHQMSARGLGTAASFTGGFALDATSGGGRLPIFGPFQIDRGRTRVMESATGFTPTEGTHMQQSEMCATCHTLYTTARAPNGEPAGRLPEQVPYLEWRHSAFPAERQTCQTCHMPVVREPAPISSVLGNLRTGVARHVFRGGNVFMLKMLNRFRVELGVAATPQELEAAARWTAQQLHAGTASVSVDPPTLTGERLQFEVTVRNLAGHKLPTGYPSRRVWLDVAVSDADGRELFRSGGLSAEGRIAGNDNDAEPLRYEPHYREILDADQVQIYESVMVDSLGAVTTGLLKGVRYAKDNRLLPRGFQKTTAHPDAAVVGSAADDGDFGGGGDRVRYSVRVPGASGPLTVAVSLRFQPIAYRWAQNLKQFPAVEPQRFVTFFESMASASSEVLAQATTRTDR